MHTLYGLQSNFGSISSLVKSQSGMAESQPISSPFIQLTGTGSVVEALRVLRSTWNILQPEALKHN